MNIGIIGMGNVGGTLGTRWAAAGHQVMFGVRDPSDHKAKDLAARAGGGACVDTVAAAARFGEVVVLATPFDAAEEALHSAGDLKGKVVIDCTNPFTPDLTGLSIGHTASAGEKVASWARGASVVKALNTTGAGNMADPRYGSERATMFVCGDDAAAKLTVTSLVETLGFEVVDAGPLSNARLLEPLAMLWISLAYRSGLGLNIAFRLLRR